MLCVHLNRAVRLDGAHIVNYRAAPWIAQLNKTMSVLLHHSRDAVGVSLYQTALHGFSVQAPGADAFRKKCFAADADGNVLLQRRLERLIGFNSVLRVFSAHGSVLKMSVERFVQMSIKDGQEMFTQLIFGDGGLLLRLQYHVGNHQERLQPFLYGCVFPDFRIVKDVREIFQIDGRRKHIF